MLCLERMCRVVGNGMESWLCLHLFVEQTVFGHESRLQHQDRDQARELVSVHGLLRVSVLWQGLLRP